MLKLAKRRGSSSFYARGAYLGERVFESLGTRDREEADRLLATLQNGIFERQARGGVQPVEGFVSAATRYMESGGERRFVATSKLSTGSRRHSIRTAQRQPATGKSTRRYRRFSSSPA